MPSPCGMAERQFFWRYRQQAMTPFAAESYYSSKKVFPLSVLIRVIRGHNSFFMCLIRSPQL